MVSMLICLQTVQERDMKRFSVSLQYNSLLNGKWNHMMDQTHWVYILAATSNK
jgi:hypothetical protein